MSNYPENEQWRENAGGDCPKCRRFSYCKKPCTENKRVVREHLMKIIRQKLEETKSKQKEEAE